jgi:hypothetical protein
MTAEDDNRRALQTKLSELDHLSESLLIKAPRAGMISANDLSSLIGRYVTPGQELLVIGDPDEKEVRVLIAQDQFDETITQASVRLNGDGSETIGRLYKVDPRATTYPPHPALCAGAGGPVATKISHDHNSAQRTGDERDQQEFLDPHVVGYVKLDARVSHQFGPGQLATVQMNGPRRLLRDWLLEAGRKWLSMRS